ncbi:unnamed protein product [Brassica napus]|uniref:(rape) hypothetical protein n=1 Tax=Brassica napus TaxID=3708 RepID=A0A816KXD5_BRANA|nr:unnamed protein product [Brassica napus]
MRKRRRFWSSCTSTGTPEVHINGASRSKIWQRRTKKSTALSMVIPFYFESLFVYLSTHKFIKDEGGQRRTWLRAWLKRQVWRKTVTPERSW